ncbi:MAG: membrane protein insertase YidC, partial [Clostridia bacterium]
ILFTLIIKVIFLPLDYWSRAGMKKNQILMEKMRPQLEKLQKQYANDKMLYNQKMQALYKKEGYSMFGACVPSLVTMVLFILVFNALNSYLKYNLINAYNEMLAAYLAVGENPVEWAKIALTFQDKISPSFLWIKNVWQPDSPLVKAVMSAADFTKFTGIKVEAVLQYEPMMAPFVAVNSGVNGYFILPVLSGATSFLMQWVMSKTQKTQMELQGQGSTNKMMLIMMPIMMAVFALSWTAAFAIYLVASSVISFLFTIIINWIVDLRYRKLEAEIKNANVRK